MTLAHNIRVQIPRLAVITGLFLVGGCVEDSVFTEEERDELMTMVLDDNTPIPTSRTNRFADNLAAAKLGQMIFFDTRMITGNGGCRKCHELPRGGADIVSTGPTTVLTGPLGTTISGRNTPTVFNVAFLPGINHWSGNFSAVWSVPSDAGSSTLFQAHFMFRDPTYKAAYEELFGPMPDMTDTVKFPATGNWRSPAWQALPVEDQRALGRFETNLGKSIEAFERRLIDKNSAFDRYMNGDEKALSASAIRGAKLFIGKAACNECHSGPNFSDFGFHNVGVPQGEGVAKVDYGMIAAGGFQATYPFNAHSEFSDDPDYGASLVANMRNATAAELPMLCNKEDPQPGCGAFKTARLRSIALTSPYFHTGGVTNLWDVVEFYNEGAGTDGYVGHRDIAIQPLFLTDEEITDLVSFLTSLTGEPIADEWARCPKNIPATACTAP